MASAAEKLIALVGDMPEREIGEVLDFAEFVKSRRAGDAAKPAQPENLARRFDQFQFDMGGFRFDREEANARR